MWLKVYCQLIKTRDGQLKNFQNFNYFYTRRQIFLACFLKQFLISITFFKQNFKVPSLLKDLLLSYQECKMSYWGRDWRSPGDEWLKENDGRWVKAKLCRQHLMESLNESYLHRWVHIFELFWSYPLSNYVLTYQH